MSNSDDAAISGTAVLRDEVGESKLPENCDHENTEPLPDYVSVDGRSCNDCGRYIDPEGDK